MKFAKRIAIFVLLGLLTFALGVWMAPFKQPQNILVLRQNPWQMLLSVEGDNLLKLEMPVRKMVMGAVEATTGRSYENRPGEYIPALFQSMLNTQGQKRYVLVELSSLAIIPGSSFLRIHVFNTSGELLHSQKFNAGYRTTVTSIQIRETQLTENQLLVVGTSYVLSGHPATQYYALAGNNMDLIYLEQDGRLDSNNYTDTHMTIGPQPDRQVIAWENALGSTDDAEVLAALTWFNGNRALTSRDRAYRRLVDLTRHENEFIKNAAESMVGKH